MALYLNNSSFILNNGSFLVNNPTASSGGGGGGIDIISSGLVLYVNGSNSTSYPGSGTTWYDLSGNSNNGTIVNTFTYASQSINFPSANNVYVNHGAPSVLNDLAASSFNVVIKPNSWLAKSLMYKSDNNNSAGFFFEMTNNAFGLSIVASSTNARRIASTATVTTTTFNMLTATWDGSGLASSTIKLYINGTEITTYSTDQSGAGSHTTDAAYPFYLGYNGSGTQDWFTGYMGAAFVYNRVLNASEVLQNYNTLKSTYSLP
jgi:hypothetical protein